MWISLKNPILVRNKNFPQIVNLENGNRFYIDIINNQHEVETDLHVWGSWMNTKTQRLFTGSESECVNFINDLAKRLNAVNMPKGSKTTGSIL